jgi:hypothetical protein
MTSTMAPRAALGGLTAEQARQRLRSGGPNELPRPPEPGVVRRAGRELAEPLPLLLLTAALVTGAVLGDMRQSLMCAGVSRSLTTTLSSGHCLRVAYMRTVIAVHEPNAARSNSYGVGPSPLPPTSAGSSATSAWLGISSSVRKPDGPVRATIQPAASVASASPDGA